MVYKPKGRRFYLVEFRFHGKRILKRTKMTRIEDARAMENTIHPQAETVEKAFKKTAEGYRPDALPLERRVCGRS